MTGADSSGNAGRSVETRQPERNAADCGVNRGSIMPQGRRHWDSNSRDPASTDRTSQRRRSATASSLAICCRTRIRQVEARRPFFVAVGFSAQNPQDLADALRGYALQAPSVGVAVTHFGTKFAIDGPMRTPLGSDSAVRSVWFLETGQTSVRFVTAYPLRGHGS